jgi:hypothetical protein
MHPYPMAREASASVRYGSSRGPLRKRPFYVQSTPTPNKKPRALARGFRRTAPKCRSWGRGSRSRIDLVFLRLARFYSRQSLLFTDATKRRMRDNKTCMFRPTS